MTTYLLDSDAVIDQLNGFAPTVRLLAQLVDDGQRLAVNEIVIAEIFSGVPPLRRAGVQALLDQARRLRVDDDVARLASELRYDAARRGWSVALADSLNAATAHHYGATLVTGNLRHFRILRVPILPLPRT